MQLTSKRSTVLKLMMATGLQKLVTTLSANAEFTLHDFRPDFHPPTGFTKSLTNAQNRRQIGALSKLNMQEDLETNV